MKVSNIVGERFREVPSECVIDSHIFMIRGGYLKYVAGGIYSQFTPLKRICRKIEQIIREEMDAIGGQEVLFPVALPGELWEESGRYASVGKELLRFRDRNGSAMVLGMTHEEAAVQLVREYGQSYQRYPFMLYQIQTKFRDEARPRGGLIRVREFTMKDAYSFHTSQEDLDSYYRRCYQAYERIYQRAGLPGVVSVASDSGMMGGNLSHEFMYLTPVGEDSIATCPQCGYRSNVEAAQSIAAPCSTKPPKELHLAETPGAQTIEQLCSFLSLSPEQTLKTVAYQLQDTGKTVLLFLRGDKEVNETKLANYLGESVIPAVLDEAEGFTPGYLGPLHLPQGATALFDASLRGESCLACGANKVGYHYTGLCLERDCATAEFHDFSKIQEGGVCPECGASSITISRGIEVGNIFQLGDKYTRPMNMAYADDAGELLHPLMGCYGIGVGRLAACICEAHHDEHGPIWPMAVAPWQVQICCIRADQAEAKACADNLYASLQQARIEVLYDDREVSAGVMFSDADLFGVPIRVIVSPRNLSLGKVEVVGRDKSWKKLISVEELVPFVRDKLTIHF